MSLSIDSFSLPVGNIDKKEQLIAPTDTPQKASYTTPSSPKIYFSAPA
jgi:hypothetical protein